MARDVFGWVREKKGALQDSGQGKRV